jgi:hypothetical protein
MRSAAADELCAPSVGPVNNAKALGLHVPDVVRLRANEVIQ